MTQVLHLSSWWNSFSSLCSYQPKSFSFVSGGISPHSFGDVFHKSTSNLLFSLLVFQQLRSTLLLRIPFQALLSQKLAFSSTFVYLNYLSSILSSGGLVMLLFSIIISNCEDHVLFVLIHLTRVSCPLLKFFSSYLVLYHFSTGVLFEFGLPWSPSLTGAFSIYIFPSTSRFRNALCP